jgi:hypothetical protein
MIDDTFRKIQSRLEGTSSLSQEQKKELLDLTAELRREIDTLSRTDRDQAESIAGFANVSTHEATRAQPEPRLVQLSLDGLASTVSGFERAHPKLTEIVNRISTVLSNLGI